MATLTLAPTVEEAQAGLLLHGLGVQKVCDKVEIDTFNHCFIVVSNDDTFDDEITINDVCDDIGGDVNCMSTDPNITVDTVSGGATCANANTELPCQLPNSDSQVIFLEESHFMDVAGSNPDTATVEWVDNCDSGVPSCNGDDQFSDAPSATFVEDPSIDVDKAAHEKSAEGDELPVSVLVTNTGNVALTNVQAIDTHAGALVCGDTDLDPGDDTTCTGSFIVAGSGSNTVTATGDSQLETVEAEDTEPFTVENPAIDVTKVCEVTDGGSSITWTIDVDNTGDVTLAVEAEDTRHGPLFNGNMDAGDNFNVSFVEFLGPGTYVDTASATGTHQLGTVSDDSTAECTLEFAEGLTPGFWKANAEKWDAGAWLELPEDDFNSVFGTDVELRLAKGNADTDKGTSDNPTLFGALGARGGDENALARHCVAAKLNAEEGHIDYPMSRAEVIAQCADALNGGDSDEINDLKDLLDEQNNLGADISQHHIGS